MVSMVRLVILLVAPLVVLGCEGECITDITHEYLKLYRPIIHNALQNMANRIDTQIVPPNDRRRDPITYFNPVVDAFNKASYDGLRHAIFPSYFHGKCLDANGTVPNGCPNPDCPVVCGTPGSMVHFFPKLTQIVFDQVSGQLTNITSPGTRSYQQVEKKVLADAQKTRRTLSRVARSAKFQQRGATTAEKRFRAIMKDTPTMMLTACGGSNLAQCRWETHMKKFILRYP